MVGELMGSCHSGHGMSSEEFVSIGNMLKKIPRGQSVSGVPDMTMDMKVVSTSAELGSVVLWEARNDQGLSWQKLRSGVTYLVTEMMYSQRIHTTMLSFQ